MPSATLFHSSVIYYGENENDLFLNEKNFDLFDTIVFCELFLFSLIFLGFCYEILNFYMGIVRIIISMLIEHEHCSRNFRGFWMTT